MSIFNYSYQTIAHNVVTMTDPQDTAPMPGKDGQPPRPIANDGGRRLGSGWGKRAPIDPKEWQAHYATYHTGRIFRHHAGDDLVIAVGVDPGLYQPPLRAGEFFRAHLGSSGIGELSFTPVKKISWWYTMI